MISATLTPKLEEREAERRLAENPRDAEACMAKADHCMIRNDRRGANAWYSAAVRADQADTLLSAEECTRAKLTLTELQAYFTEHTLSTLYSAGFPKTDWHPRFAKAMAIMHGERGRDPSTSAYPQLPTNFYYPDLPYLTFADTNLFAWREIIESATSVIRAEAEALLSSDEGFAPYVRRTSERPQGDVHGMIDNSDWKTLDLTLMGLPVPERVALAPRTYDAVSENAPLCDVPQRAPSIMFSLLAAGKRIPPHTGTINTRLICHLPLVVPGDGALRVGNDTKQWVEGELLAFDDTVEHEAWNSADRDRLVLIFDVWRPELEEIERAQIRTLFEAVNSA